MRSLRFSDDAGCISKTRSWQNRKWYNSRIINPIFEGLTDITRRDFVARILLRNSQNTRALYI